MRELKEIKQGSVVCLNSDSIDQKFKMTVNELGPETAEVLWIDIAGEMHSEEINQTSLFVID